MGSPESDRLFAEKGNARPANLVRQPVQDLLGSLESQLIPSREDGGALSPALSDPAPDLLGDTQSDAPELPEPASLLTIDLRRPRSPNLALAPEPAPDMAQDNEPPVEASDDEDNESERAPAALVSRPAVDEAPETGSKTAQALLAGLAVACLAGGLWYAFHAAGTDPAERRAAAQPASAETTPETPAPAEPVAAAPEPAPAPEPEVAVAPSPQTIAPSFDLVRIEPDGQAVLAGRAEPHVALILLDNGAPLGTVTADGAGEWAFVPEAPLKAGDHDFSLVVNSPQGEVTVLEQTKSKVPDVKPVATPAPAAVPARKPQVAAVPSEPQAATGQSYAVQLVSVSTQKDAEAAWQSLRHAYPALLGDMTFKVEQATLDDQAVRYRVHAGDFANAEQAEALCRSLSAQQQDCIVVRR